MVEQAEVSQYFETEQEPAPGEPRKCITGKSEYGFCACCGIDGIQCCAACVEDCNIRCGWLEEQTEKTPAADEPENAAEKQQEEDIVKPIEYDRNTLEGMIQSEKEILDVMRDYWIKSQPYTYVKHSMMLKAYELFLQTHEGKIT